jgi:hypothetical protein
MGNFSDLVDEKHNFCLEHLSDIHKSSDI